jgi:hypothetical protein
MSGEDTIPFDGDDLSTIEEVATGTKRSADFGLAEDEGSEDLGLTQGSDTQGSDAQGVTQGVTTTEGAGAPPLKRGKSTAGPEENGGLETVPQWAIQLTNAPQALGPRQEFGSNGVYVRYLSVAAGKKMEIVTPPAVIKSAKLSGIGEPPYRRPDDSRPPATPDQYNFSLALKFGEGALSPMVQARDPKLAAEHQQFIERMLSLTHELTRACFNMGDDKVKKEACIQAAKEQFARNNEGYPSEFSILKKNELVDLLVADGETRDDAMALVRNSGLLERGECDDDSDADARQRIVALSAESSEAKKTAQIDQDAYEAYSNGLRFPGTIEGEPGKRTMTIYLDRKSSYVPRQYPKKLEARRDCGNPTLQQVLDLVGAWGPNIKSHVSYKTAKNMPLRDLETGKTYDELTSLENNPLLEVVSAGDLASIALGIRTYYDANGHRGVKFDVPMRWDIIVHARNIPDAAEMLDFKGDDHGIANNDYATF